MRVQSFLGKVHTEGLRLMDEHINEWMEHHNISPTQITQTMGMEIVGDASHSEPVVVTSIWYEGTD